MFEIRNCYNFNLSRSFLQDFFINPEQILELWSKFALRNQLENNSEHTAQNVARFLELKMGYQGESFNSGCHWHFHVHHTSVSKINTGHITKFLTLLIVIICRGASSIQVSTVYQVWIMRFNGDWRNRFPWRYLSYTKRQPKQMVYLLGFASTFDIILMSGK